MLFPQDHLFLFGDKEQTEHATSLLLQQRPEAESASAEKTIEIERIYVNQDSELNEKTLAGTNLRQRYGVTVLGIQRGEQRITSPGRILSSIPETSFLSSAISVPSTSCSSRKNSFPAL